MLMFDDLLEEATIVDCILEIDEIASKATFLSNEKLVNFIMDWDTNIEIGEDAQLALNEFFNTGKLCKENRKVLENCYILMRNCLCWGEDEDGSGVYSTHVLLK
jgi:hypothetical protein